jgi:pyruvate dehydrogenase E1 component alpha subunit
MPTTLELAEEILRLRLSQMLINEEYKAGKFKIPVHLALGHEATAVAVNHTVKDEDKLVPSHRNMEYNLVRAGKLRPILDEYLLKPTGLMQGRLGSMNLINPSRGIIYSCSILGNSVPVSIGIALAEKITEREGVTIIFGGDGSVEEGTFYEGLTMAKTFGVRLIFLIENNEWSLGTHISERRCPIDLEKLTSSVGVPYLKMEGNHAHKYIETLRSVRERVLRDSQPICVEVVVKTLGDRRAPPTPEFPEGRYINYHAGPAPTVDILTHFPGGILRESEDDPVFVLGEEIGREKLFALSEKVMQELQVELQ